MINTTIKTPGSMNFLEQMSAKYDAMTPEQKEECARQEQERHEKAKVLQRDEQVERLRTHWDAPQRHLSLLQPDRKGEWGNKLGMLEARIGSGFTVALVGVRGNGKTQMAVQLMIAATARLKSAKFCTAAKFFMAIKAGYRKDSDETEFNVIQAYRRPAILVIDEIGKRSDSGWENSLLFELLNDRYNDMTDTVLIDNRPKADFVAAIGPSLASRMAESGGIIECTWESFR